MAPVEGVVTLDGEPLPAGRITFWPAGGRSGSGWIAEDGRFVIGTFQPDDGALVGRHRVSVTPAVQAEGQPDFDQDPPPSGWPRSKIPVRYSNPDSSGLAFDVKPGVNRFEIDLTSR